MRQLPSNSDGPMHGWQPYSAVHAERVRAHAKHAPNKGSMEQRAWDSPWWLPVVMEEIGEAAAEICEYNLGNCTRDDLKDALTEELTQVAAMVCAWLDALSETEYS